MTVSERNRKIHTALNDPMKALGYQGESGADAMFPVLYEAFQQVDANWHIVENSRAEGLCYDVNALRADAIERRQREAVVPRHG
jgi:hypothetical protein